MLALSFLISACATPSRKRPPCTWEVWAVDGALVNADDGRRLPCNGPLAADCAGFTKIDLMNLLECGGRPQPKAAPAPVPAKGPQP
jgi:hypothetical protein